MVTIIANIDLDYKLLEFTKSDLRHVIHQKV